MLRADSNHPPHPPGAPRGDGRAPGDSACPSLMALAAYAERRLGEEDNERIEAHVANCAPCFDLLAGLGADVSAIENEARLLIVPAAVIGAAMSLRATEMPARLREQPLRITPPWLIFARRSLAAAAALGIAFAGYHVGTSFTGAPAASASPGTAAGLTSQDIAFGLLDPASGASDDETSDLFALAYSGTAVREATP